MFSFFKPKSTPLDGVIKAVYGENPPKKSADVERATYIAHEDLLGNAVTRQKVEQLARQLFAGPMPYSTYDLAVSVALSFFKDPSLIERLRDVQLSARMRVLGWLTDGKLAPLIAKSFEDMLYKLYAPLTLRPINLSTQIAKNELEIAFLELGRNALELHPTIYSAMLAEATLISTEAAIARFVGILEMLDAEGDSLSDDEKANVLLAAYEAIGEEFAKR